MITPDDARLLDRLTLGGSPVAAATSSGHRRARTRGAGLEFHEYRHYQPGDDPRSIDWTVEARLQQLVVRVSRAEGEARLHVLVDVSASMGIGTPDKLACAKRVAAALCYVALERRDAASASIFLDRVLRRVPPASGRPQLFRVLSMLGAATAAGRSSVNRALAAYGAALRGPGLVVVLSDFFDPDGGLEGLRYLQHRGFTPAVVQIVAPEEIEPPVHDETELVDIEDATAPPLIVDAAAVLKYRMRMDEHTWALRSFCRTNRLPWVRISAGTPFKEQLSTLEQAGLFAAYA